MREDQMGGDCSTHGRDEKFVQNLVSKGRYHFGWEDNINVDFKAGCRLDSSGSGYNPVTCYCEHDKEFLDSIKDGEFLD
jgi:hypothetical protein